MMSGPHDNAKRACRQPAALRAARRRLPMVRPHHREVNQPLQPARQAASPPPTAPSRIPEAPHEPDRRHPRPHGIHPAAGQAARRHPRPADDRARAGPRALEADIGPVAVACAEPEIAAAVRAAGGIAVLTDPALPSGSDRVHAALATLDPDGAARRGGQPAGRPAEPSRRRSCAPCSPPLADPASTSARWWRRSAAPTEEAAASSWSKPPAPSRRDARSRRRCISRAARSRGATGRAGTISASTPGAATALARFVALPPSPLERRESLEQLRALEAGMRMACARVAIAPFGVDTPADLERARRVLAGAAA